MPSGASAFNFKMPCCRIFPAALISLSCIASQEHTHDRTFKGISACFKPQTEQVFVDGNHWSILTRGFPSCFALYSNLAISDDQPASEMALANCLFLTMFLTFSVSTITAWFSSMSCLESLCWKSLRALATRSCAFAKSNWAFILPLEPLWQRDSAFCFLRRFR